MSTHRAVATTAKGVVEEIQVPTPAPGAGEVQLKAAYGAMIAFDTYQADRGFYVQQYPVVLGFSASGTVESVGEGVGDLKVGDRVTAFTYGPSPRRALQEYSVQPRTAVAKIPDSLALEAAATIPDNFVTAFYTLFGSSNLGLPLPPSFPAPSPPPRAETPILVYGAGAVAGIYIVQLLRLAGYTRVIATASPKHHAYLLSLGASQVFDYRSPTLLSDLGKAAGPTGKYEVAVDSITAQETLGIVAGVVGDQATVAILVPIKEGGTITNAVEQALWLSLPEEQNPFGKGVKVVSVRTLLYHQDEFLRDNLMPRILPELLSKGYIQPAPVRLLNQGSFRDRVAEGVALFRDNKVSGEKVIVKVGN